MLGKVTQHKVLSAKSYCPPPSPSSESSHGRHFSAAASGPDSSHSRPFDTSDLMTTESFDLINSSDSADLFVCGSAQASETLLAEDLLADHISSRPLDAPSVTGDPVAAASFVCGPHAKSETIIAEQDCTCTAIGSFEDLCTPAADIEALVSHICSKQIEVGITDLGLLQVD